MKPLLTAFLILLSLVGISVIPNSFNKNISVSTVDTLPPYNTNYQSLGSQNVMVQVRGGIKGDSTMIMPLYADTAAANLKRTVWYGGAMIFTADNNFWIRNMAATAWLKVIGGGSGGGGAVDSVTSTKLACLDIQKYWSGGTGIAYDTIALYDGILKPGLVTQTGVLTFDVTQYIYRLACELTKTPLDTTVSVSAADDSLLRIDLIGGNGLGQVQVIEGTPSESATPPTYDINQFIPFTQVFISSDTTYLIPIAPNLDGRYVKIAVPDTITAQKTVRDTLILGPYPLASDNLIIKAGTPINQFAYAIDTVALQQVRANFWQYVIGTSGTTVPKYSMLFKSPYATPLSLNANGDVTFGNGISMSGTRNVTSNGAMTFLPNIGGVGNGFNFTNPTDALISTSIWANIDIGGSTAQKGATSLLVRGDRKDSVLRVYSDDRVSIGNNASRVYGGFTVNQRGRYVLMDTMNTTNRDGIVWNITGTSVSNGGSGMVRKAPTATAANPLGGRQARFTVTVSGGIVTGITINDAGSSYFTSGSIIFDTTGCTIGVGNVLPIATYSVTQGTFDVGAMIFNTDSSCYQSRNVSGWYNLKEGSGGGGGSGTVTSFGKVDGYGITSSVTNPTTTPVHTIAVDTATLFPAIRATLPPETYDSLKTKYPIVITSTSGLDSIGLSSSFIDSIFAAMPSSGAGLKFAFSATAPSDTSVAWIDTSTNILKMYPIRVRVPGQWSAKDSTAGLWWDDVGKIISNGPAITVVQTGQSNCLTPADLNPDGSKGDTTSSRFVTVWDTTAATGRKFREAKLGDYPYNATLSNNYVVIAMKKLAKETGRSVRMLVYSSGGQPLDCWTYTGTSGNLDTSGCYKELIKQMNQSGIKKPDYFVWSQGENGGTGDYYTKWVRLYDSLKKQGYMDSIKTLAFLMATGDPSGQSLNAPATGGNAGLRRVGNDPDFKTIYVDGAFPGKTVMNGIHWYPYGSDLIGERLYYAIKQGELDPRKQLLGFNGITALTNTKDSFPVLAQGAIFEAENRQPILSLYGPFYKFHDPAASNANQGFSMNSSTTLTQVLDHNGYGMKMLSDNKVTFDQPNGLKATYLEAASGANSSVILRDVATGNYYTNVIDNTYNNIDFKFNNATKFSIGNNATGTVAIGSTAAQLNGTAILELKSTTGGLLLPRMTKAQRDLLVGVQSVTIGGGGSGYVNGAAITVTGGGGSGAAGTITVVAGVITAINITKTGTGYTSAPTVTAPTGTGASLTAVTGTPAGMQVYQTDNTPGLRVYNGTNWIKYSESTD